MESKYKKEERIKNTLDALGNLATNVFMEWLEKIGYFDAPAAKGHHSAYPGGLFDHSYEVARQLNYMTENLQLKWERQESPYIVGLLHDICKTDDYRLEKIEDTKTIYIYNQDKIITGHGDKSIFMLSGHIPLTEEETYCIRFHMGSFTDKEEWQYYSKAVNLYPNVLYTHTADMIASQIIGV